MSCIWQGSVMSVAWPHHDPLLVDLKLEMWWMNDHPEESAPRLDDVTLVFEKFVRIKDVPLWAICGPEMTIMTRDNACVDYFSQFASIGEVAMRVRISSVPSSIPPSYNNILIFIVREESTVKVAARPLNTELKFPNKVGTVQLEQPGTDTPRDKEAPLVSSTLEHTASIPESSSSKKPVSDIKKTVQQTIMGALRLRGVRSNNPNFKKLYFSVLSLVELALQKIDPQHINLHMIHDKVEAILSIID